MSIAIENKRQESRDPINETHETSSQASNETADDNPAAPQRVSLIVAPRFHQAEQDPCAREIKCELKNVVMLCGTLGATSGALIYAGISVTDYYFYPAVVSVAGLVGTGYALGKHYYGWDCAERLRTFLRR